MNVKNEKNIHLRINEKDLQIIKRNMDKYNIQNMSFYMRTVAIKPYIINVDSNELRQVNYEINKIGVNINQIAKLANQNKEINNADIKEIKDLMKKLESIKVVTTFLEDYTFNGIH